MQTFPDAPKIEREILARLADGRGYTAAEMWKNGGGVRNHPDFWPMLLKLENEGLIWRAFDYENWQTLHLWKITGCGLLREPRRLAH